MILPRDNFPFLFVYFIGGKDFGLQIAAVKVGWVGDCVYVIGDYGGFNITTKTSVENQTAKGWYDECFVTYCDPAGGERIQEVPGGVKANNSVDAGIDYIIALIERGKFFVCKDCTGVLGEIWDYSRDENNQIVKVNDHYMDAMRYAIFSAVTSGVVMA